MPGKTKKKAPTPQGAMWNNPEMAMAADISREGPRLIIPVLETIEERMLWAYKARGLSPTVFELTVVSKEPKPKRHCPVCRQTCNGDDKTLGRHIRTKSHLVNLADCLWVEFDSFLGDDIVVVCHKCGEKILGARKDSLHRHQAGPCPKKNVEGDGESELPVRPQRRMKARSDPPVEPEPESENDDSAPPATPPLAHPHPEVDDDEELPPRKVARRSIDTEVANEWHRQRTHQREDGDSSSLPPPTPTVDTASSPEGEGEGEEEEEEEEEERVKEERVESPAPLPPRTPTPASVAGPSRPRRQPLYGSTRNDSPPASPSVSRRSSVSSGKSLESDYDLGGGTHRRYSPFDISSSDEEGPLKLLANAADTFAPRMPPSPYSPASYEAQWGPEQPVSPLVKRALRRLFPSRRPSLGSPVSPALHSPVSLRFPQTPPPPSPGQYW